MSDKIRSRFLPVAVVGRGCVLPGCHSVDDLWKVVEAGRVEVNSAESDDWRVDQKKLTNDSPGIFVADHMWSTAGGYVREFDDHFDTGSFSIEPSLLEKLDPVFLWSLEAARQTLTDIALPEDTERAGVVIGNLSYPTRKHSQFAEDIWMNQIRGGDATSSVDARNRFMSGLPAMLVAQGLGLAGDTLALDAACASGLYAIKVACDRLQNHSADLMLAGGINAADPLFIHMGFCALNALSKTGKSQPFSQNADGLVPSEGAAFVALKRLEDARADGDKIYGVIRGVGLSNDGRSGGFLSPSSNGQIVSMKQTYDMSGVDPAEVQFIECHATGTEAGDSAEIESLASVFPSENKIPLGSLKGNLGHLITASGVAGLVKVLLAFEHQTIPGTPNASPGLAQIAANGFQVPGSNSPWKSNGPRVAAVSSFGFGGNNAHLLVQEDDESIPISAPAHAQSEKSLAIVALAVHAGDDKDTAAFGQRVCGNSEPCNRTDAIGQISLAATALSFPPNDLKESLGQQLVLLDLLPQIQKSISNTANDRVGIYVGMQTDSEVCRYGFRWRLDELDPEGLIKDVDREVAPSLTAAGVIGKMPNVPANRISNQLDITGPGFTISREELSGDAALQLAMEAITRGELDAAIVGAVELANEQVHEAALSQLAGLGKESISDTAILLVVKSVEQAKQDEDKILAIVEQSGHADSSATPNFVHKGGHAASGLVNLAAQVQRLRAGSSISREGIQQGSVTVTNESMFGESSSWKLSPVPEGAAPFASTDNPQLELYVAQDKAALISKVSNGEFFVPGDPMGECRLALVGLDANLPGLRERAIKGLSVEHSGQIANAAWSLDGISYSEASMAGEIASVFTGAAAAYPGMGADLFLGLPDVATKLALDMPGSAEAMQAAFDEQDERHSLPSFQLAGCSYLCQLHARIVMDMLHIAPTVAMGLSSGETNSMFAFGVWQDMDGLLKDIDNTALYHSALAADFTSIREVWGLDEKDNVDWVNYRVLAPVDEIKKAVDTEDRAYVTIIQTGKDAVLGGDRSACQSVLKSLGDPEVIPLGHDLAVHCNVVAPFEPIWRKIHTRRTSDPKGVRFYSNYLDGAYKVNKNTVADALTGQALQTIDFPKIVNKAWDDGVRIFIEHGPRNSLASAIDEILGDREHLAVSLDHSAVSSMTQLYRTIGTLWCAGVDMDFARIRLTEPSTEEPVIPVIKFNLRLPSIQSRAKRTNQQTTKMPERSIQEQPVQHAIPDEVQVYRPPICSVGPVNGRLIPAAPLLATTLRYLPSRPMTVEKKQVPVVPSMKTARAPETKKGTTAPVPQQALAQPSVQATEVDSVAVTQIASPVSSVPASTPATSTNVAVNEHQLLINGHRQMLAAHQDFLAAQVKGQTAFTETMARIQQSLFSGAEISAIPSAPVGLTPNVQAPVAPLVKPPFSIRSPDTPTKVAAAVPAEELREEDVKPVKIARPGPNFSRAQLEVLAGGKISSVLGELFEQQDGYDVQVRMPEPPLLLCDRVIGIEGEAGSMGTGTIWTETDVDHDKWYLHHGRMPPGIFIESGQADLLLISWLGIDFHNKGDRAYRLLGCELVFHSDLPQPGDTLEYEIKVDGHAQQGDVRLFFFHYDCQIDGQPRISVRNGQAGFFTKEELADSAGVLWDAETADYTPDIAPVEAAATTEKTAFSREDVAAYLDGRLYDCFGDAFEYAHTHTRTPGSPADKGNFLGEVTDFDPNGGPAGRGYLRIVEDIHADDWFFEGHFKNDPCMPGTLMADACLQAMAFYMSARGHTLHRDGWRFQPVRETNYKFVCRGQATPESKKLVYEVFIDEEVIDKEPRIFAHVLCTVDGRKAFLCERLGLELVPDWPLSSMPELLEPVSDDRPLAKINNFPLDYQSLISCAWGKPSNAFGEGFAHYDGPLRSPRLPGPPYHFMTRIVTLEGEMASMKAGGYVEALYDIPADDWYFLENSSKTMPYCVLLEIGLQPCGWLASYTLGRDFADSDLLFRNLDGKAVQHREIVPGDKTIKTAVKLTSISKIGELIIENFDVTCTIDDEVVYTVSTVFGFFPPDAMMAQKGLAISDRERDILERSTNHQVNLEDRPGLYFNHPTLHLPDSKLLMVDRITYLDAEDGASGSIRGEKDVDLSEWFFKAHFFQDPVQPGSLGIEAMLQLMQAFMISQDMHQGFDKPRFEPVLIGIESEWHYRGQVTPEKELITIDFECAERGADDNSCWVSGEARLWADGLKIYHAPRIGMRIVEDQHGLAITPGSTETSDQSNELPGHWKLDLATSPWIGDHRPTYTVPSLPMMAELDMMAEAARVSHPTLKVTGIARADAKSWLAFWQSSVEGHIDVGELQDGLVDVQLFSNESADGKPSASAKINLAAEYPAAPEPTIVPLASGREINNIYESGSLFHGPAFQLLTQLELGANGSSGVLDLSRNGVPPGILSPGLLDAALHCLPHDGMEHWSEEIPVDHAAYPLRVENLILYSAFPTTGLVQVEARFVDVRGRRFPRTHIWLLGKGELIAEFTLTEVLMPKGPIGTLQPDHRKAFLTGERYIEGAGVTTFDGVTTTASLVDVTTSNWLPGTMESAYGFDSNDGSELLGRVVASEHVGRILRLHPSKVQLNDQGQCLNVPLNSFQIESQCEGKNCSATGCDSKLDWRQIRDFWVDRSAGEHYLVHDLGTALIRQFVRHIVIEDPEDFHRRVGQPAIYLANHQIYAESFLFLSAIAALTGIPAEAIAKQEHKEDWIGDVYRLAEAEMGDQNPMQILFLDREDPSHLLEILDGYSQSVKENPRSLLVHVEGTRATQAGQRTEKVSSVLVDLSIKCDIPIVPVRFCGGLPLESNGNKYHFPVGLGKQDHYIGAAIEPERLDSLPYKERAVKILDGINNLGADGEMDSPLVSDETFSKIVAEQTKSVSELSRVLLSAVESMPELGDRMTRVLTRLSSGDLDGISPAEKILMKLLAGKE